MPNGIINIRDIIMYMQKIRNSLLAITFAAAMLSGCSGNDTSYTVSDTENDGLWQYTEIAGQKIDNMALGKEYTVSFWLFPADNFTDSTIFFAGDAENYILCTNRGINGEVFSGITLSSHFSGEDYWIVADGEHAPMTSRWNQITVNISSGKAEIWLNGEKAAEGDLRHSGRTDTILIGDDPLGLRKLHGNISGFTVSSTLSSAQQIKDAYEGKLADVLLDTVRFPDQDHLNRSLWFYDNTVEGYPLTWQRSEDTVLMDDAGRITDLDHSGQAVFTASVSTEHSSAQKQFVFTLPGNTPEVLLQNSMKILNAEVEGTMFSGTELPAVSDDGVQFAYQVKSGQAHFEDNVLYKDTDAERETVTFEASAEYGDLTSAKTYTVVLLDEAYGYAMAYFNGEVDAETVSLALSTDGLVWAPLTGSNVSSRLFVGEDFGTMRLRDPHLSRDENGSFIMAATEGGDHPFIYLYRSDDLLSFDEGFRLLVSYPDHSLGMSGKKAWAPEVYYDNENNDYLIYYADHREDRGPVYVIHTDLDFIDGYLLYPQILFDPGYPVIDSTIFVMNGKYHMIFKDERAAAQTVYSAETDDLQDGFRTVYDWKYLQLQRPVEGPMVFRDIHTGKYHLYLDHFSAQTFFAGEFTGLDYDSEVDWSDTDLLVLPEQDVRHGSIIPVTEKEYKRIESSYK